MNFTIRRVEPADANDLAEIYSFESVIEQTSQQPYGNAAFWQNFYNSHKNGHTEFVAASGHKTIGHLGVLLNYNPRRKHTASFGIAVHPDFHRKGAGKALMNVLIDLSDNWLNLLRLELSVFSDNTAAIALYQQFDFIMEGESRYDLFRKGRYCHSTHMARLHPKYRDWLYQQQNNL